MRFGKRLQVADERLDIRQFFSRILIDGRDLGIQGTTNIHNLPDEVKVHGRGEKQQHHQCDHQQLSQ